MRDISTIIAHRETATTEELEYAIRFMEGAPLSAVEWGILDHMRTILGDPCYHPRRTGRKTLGPAMNVCRF